MPVSPADRTEVLRTLSKAPSKVPPVVHFEDPRTSDASEKRQRLSQEIVLGRPDSPGMAGDLPPGEIAGPDSPGYEDEGEEIDREVVRMCDRFSLIFDGFL